MRLRSLLLTAVFFALVGCAGENIAAHPYQAEFEQALRDATSDFEREVLADHVITDAEMAEAYSRRAKCVTDKGITTWQTAEGNWVYSTNKYVAPEDEEAHMAATDEIIDACNVGTTDLIESLYHSVSSNPSNRNINESIVECMIANGARPPNYTPEDLIADMLNSPETAEEDARLRRCFREPDYVGPVEVDPEWERPEVVPITVSPDGP